MKNVMIFCNAGMSSSLMAKKASDLLAKKVKTYMLMQRQQVILKILSIKISMTYT